MENGTIILSFDHCSLLMTPNLADWTVTLSSEFGERTDKSTRTRRAAQLSKFY
jgi:hypothetical protein